MKKLLGKLVLYCGGGSGSDAPPLVISYNFNSWDSPRLDFNNSVTTSIDFNN